MATPQMGRPFNFPDPRNVTVGSPTFLASPDFSGGLPTEHQNQLKIKYNVPQPDKDGYFTVVF